MGGNVVRVDADDDDADDDENESGSRKQRSYFTGGQPVESQFRFSESQVRLTTTTKTTTTKQVQADTSKAKTSLGHELEARIRKGREQSSKETEIGSEGAVHDEKLVANKLANIKSVGSARASAGRNKGQKKPTQVNESSSSGPTGAGTGGGGGIGHELQMPAEAGAELKQAREKTKASASSVQKKIGLLEALLGDRGKSWFENKTVILDIQNGKQKKPVEAESRPAEVTSKQVETNLQDKLAPSSQSKSRSNQKAADQPASDNRNGNNKQQAQDQEHEQQQVSTTSSGNVVKYSRLPTFGSIPQRLSNLSSQARSLHLSRPPSLPYFSYQGHARNIDITQRPKTPTGKNQASSGHDRFRYSRTSDADGSLASGRLSNSSASSSGFGNLVSSSLASNSSGSGGRSQQDYRSRSASRKSVSTRAELQNRTETQAGIQSETTHRTVRRLSLSSSSSKQLVGAAKGVPPTQPKPAISRKASSLGYSNISNLFPSEPAVARLWRPGSRQSGSIGTPAATSNRQRYKSASLLNLSESHLQQQQQQQQQQSRPGSSKSKFSPTSLAAKHNGLAQSVGPRPAPPVQTIRSQHQQANAASASTKRGSTTSSTMRRQGAGQSQQHLGSSAASATNLGNSKRDGGRLRPVSASGNYLGPGANRQRSPLSAGAYRLGSAGMSPLIDPDCPVHGDNLGQATPAPGRGRYSTNNPADQYEHDDYARSRYAGHAGAASNSRAYYSASQPDLLFNEDRGPANQYQDDPYNTARPTYGGSAGGPDRTAGYKSSSVYSPMSPQAADHSFDSHPYRNNGQWTDNELQQQQRRYDKTGGGTGTTSPYYNSVSRFSMYQPTGDGNIRSSLAPTSEQLRRILGYKPSSVPKPVHLHPQWAYTRPFIHLQPAGSGFGRSPSPLGDMDGDYLDDDQPEVPKFAPFNRLQDNQAIRAVDFHPSGEVYAIGSNSRALRICAYPAEHELRHFDPLDSGGGSGGGGLLGESDMASGANQQQQSQWQPKPPRVLFKFLQVHRGSIYCVSFNPSGQLLATGSNDQTIHIVKYNSISHNPDGEEFRLTMHNGTIRDLCFIDDSSGNGSSLLLSAGGGDNKIYVTDCDTITPFQSMAGHTQMVMALNHCGGAQFVSGSYDKTIRFWDLRSRSCTSIVSAPPIQATATSSGPGAPVCALRVDPSGRLLASGHTDTTCMLYDIRGGKIIQTFRPHDDEIRAISFSPKSYYLLTGGYDGRLVVSDLQGDLTQPLPSVCVAESQDKIVQAKWHPADFTFVSTSADKSATLWSLPGEIHN